MDISGRNGDEGAFRIGSGSNNTMSLWTWPWVKSRRLQLRQRQQQQQRQRFFNLYHSNSSKFKYGLLLMVLLFCLVYRDDYDVSQGYLMDIDTKTKHTMTKGSGGGKPAGGLSLAVIVAGSTQRFLFDSFAQHVAGASGEKKNTNNSSSNNNNNNSNIIKPVTIDYFAILTLKSGPAFRQDAGYMGHLAGRDRLFDGILNASADSNNDKENHSRAIRSKMMESMTNALKASSSSSSSITTNLRVLRLLEEPIEDDPVLNAVRDREQTRFETKKALKGTAAGAEKKTQSFDLFQQYPMMDKREKALTRTQAGNKNMIRLFLALESLWKTEFLDYEKNQTSKSYSPSYDYVLILRDDTLWLGDFDLHGVIASDPTADAYILSCDGRDPKMLPPEINDHGILIKREKADIIGQYVSALVALDLQKCHESVTEWLGTERGCNSEMILKHVLETNHIKVKLVPQSVLPFERAVLIEGDKKEDYYCYHKFCQSIDQPLQLPPGIQKCNELKFDK